MLTSQFTNSTTDTTFALVDSSELGSYVFALTTGEGVTFETLFIDSYQISVELAEGEIEDPEVYPQTHKQLQTDTRLVNPADYNDIQYPDDFSDRQGSAPNTLYYLDFTLEMNGAGCEGGAF